jgi:hypothetical protein
VTKLVKKSTFSFLGPGEGKFPQTIQQHSSCLFFFSGTNDHSKREGKEERKKQGVDIGLSGLASKIPLIIMGERDIWWCLEAVKVGGRGQKEQRNGIKWGEEGEKHIGGKIEELKQKI